MFEGACDARKVDGEWKEWYRGERSKESEVGSKRANERQANSICHGPGQEPTGLY